jgi:hypothetical protein
MLERIAEASSRLKARIVGGLYLSGILNLVAGTVIGGLVVKGDAVATAHNILTHEASYRLAFAGDIFTVPCYIAVSVLYYDLFKPVNRSIALRGAFFGLAGSTMWALNDFFYLGPWSCWEARTPRMRQTHCGRWRCYFLICIPKVPTL